MNSLFVCATRRVVRHYNSFANLRLPLLCRIYYAKKCRVLKDSVSRFSMNRCFQIYFVRTSKYLRDFIFRFDAIGGRYLIELFGDKVPVWVSLLCIVLADVCRALISPARLYAVCTLTHSSVFLLICSLQEHGAVRFIVTTCTIKKKNWTFGLWLCIICILLKITIIFSEVTWNCNDVMCTVGDKISRVLVCGWRFSILAVVLRNNRHTVQRKVYRKLYYDRLRPVQVHW